MPDQNQKCPQGLRTMQFKIEYFYWKHHVEYMHNLKWLHKPFKIPIGLDFFVEPVIQKTEIKYWGSSFYEYAVPSDLELIVHGPGLPPQGKKLTFKWFYELRTSSEKAGWWYKWHKGKTLDQKVLEITVESKHFIVRISNGYTEQPFGGIQPNNEPYVATWHMCYCCTGPWEKFAPQFEPNDTMETATPLKLGSTKEQTSIELTDLTLLENDVDFFKIEYPEPNCSPPFKKGLGAGLFAEIYPGFLSVLVQEKYCQPLVLEIYDSKKKLKGKFHTVDTLKITCHDQYFKNQKLFLAVKNPGGKLPVRYKLSVEFCGWYGRINGKFLYKFWEYSPPPYPPPPFLELKYFDPNQFITDSEKHLSEFIKYRGKIDKADLEHGLGRIAHLAGLYDDAEMFYKHSLTAFQELGIKAREAEMLRNLGELYSAQGRAEEALENFERASQLHENLKDYLGLAHDRMSLGRHYLAKGEASKSLAALEEASPDWNGSVLNLLYQSEAFLVLNQQEATVACLILAEDISSRIRDPALSLEVDQQIELMTAQVGEQEFLELKERLAGQAETVRHRAMSMITGKLPSFVIANCAEGLGLFDQECKDEEGKRYPVIDKQVLYEGKPTCNAIDMCGIQAHAGYYMIGSGGKEFEFDIDEYPILYLTMKAEKDTDTCLLLVVHDKEPKDYMRRFIAVGKTPSGNCGCPLAKDYFTIKDDNEWHDYTYDLRKLRGDYPDAKTARMVQFYSGKLCNGIQHVFHFSSLVFKK